MHCYPPIGSLSTRVFETRTATGSDLFSLLTSLDTTTFTLSSIFTPLEMISIEIWGTTLSWHAKLSFPVALRASKTRVRKLPNVDRRPPLLLPLHVFLFVLYNKSLNDWCLGETLRFSRNKMNCFPRDQSLSVYG